VSRLAGAIFDLDGTLVDTLPVCFAAFRRAFERLGGPPHSDDAIRALFGPSEEGMMHEDPTLPLRHRVRELPARTDLIPVSGLIVQVPYRSPPLPRVVGQQVSLGNGRS
jgi:beta-phosphoglucomutase-like phosphatase (HAD superfamily)